MLNVSQGAVSQQIARLEHQLGVELIDRSGRSFALTNSGRRLLVSVGDSVDRVDRAVDNLRSGVRSSELSITTLGSFAAQWLIPRLSDFDNRVDGVRWRIDTSPGLWDLESMNVDVGIRTGLGRWRDLRAEKLFDDRLIAVAAPAIARALPAGDPAALLALPLLYDLDDPNEWSRWFSASGVEATPELASGYSDTLVMLTALRCGHGAGLIRNALIQQELENGSLVRLSESSVPAWGTYWLVYPEGREPSEAVRLFRDWLIGQAADYVQAASHRSR